MAFDPTPEHRSGSWRHGSHQRQHRTQGQGKRPQRLFEFGDVVEGTVTKVTPYSADLELPGGALGILGLAYVREGEVDLVNELEVGQKLEVQVTGKNAKGRGLFVSLRAVSDRKRAEEAGLLNKNRLLEVEIHVLSEHAADGVTRDGHRVRVLRPSKHVKSDFKIWDRYRVYLEAGRLEPGSVVTARVHPALWDSRGHGILARLEHPKHPRPLGVPLKGTVIAQRFRETPDLGYGRRGTYWLYLDVGEDMLAHVDATLFRDAFERFPVGAKIQVVLKDYNKVTGVYSGRLAEEPVPDPKWLSQPARSRFAGIVSFLTEDTAGILVDDAVVGRFNLRDAPIALVKGDYVECECLGPAVESAGSERFLKLPLRLLQVVEV